MKTIKKIPIFLVIISILFVPFTLCASAAKDFTFAVTEPPVDNYHGYIVVPYYNSQLDLHQAEMLFWVITPTVKTDNDTAPVATLSYNSTDRRLNLQFATGQTDVSYTVAVYSTTGILANSTATNGNTFCEGFKTISYSSSPVFSLSYGSLISFYNPIFQGVSFTDYFPATMGNASIIWGDDTAFYEELYKANDKLISLINGLDLTNEQLEELYSLLNQYLKNIDKNTNSLVSLLDQFYYEWYQWSWTEQGYYDRIVELLEQAIEGEKPPNQDSMQDSYDDFADIEQDLLDNEEASNAIGNFDVTIEGGAYSVIWNMITDFLNSNSKVFGLFIACLTLAFIALLLHR